MPPGLLEVRDMLDYQYWHSNLGFPVQLDAHCTRYQYRRVSGKSPSAQILKTILRCLGKWPRLCSGQAETNQWREKGKSKPWRCTWNRLMIAQVEHVPLTGSAALAILTYFALLLKHLECPAMEKDQPHQVPLLEIRRDTTSVCYSQSPRKAQKGFLFSGAC